MGWHDPFALYSGISDSPEVLENDSATAGPSMRHLLQLQELIVVYNVGDGALDVPTSIISCICIDRANWFYFCLYKKQNLLLS